MLLALLLLLPNLGIGYLFLFGNKPGYKQTQLMSYIFVVRDELISQSFELYTDVVLEIALSLCVAPLTLRIGNAQIIG